MAPVHQPRAAKGPPLPSMFLSCLLVLLPVIIIGSPSDSGNYYITEWQTTSSDHNPPVSSNPSDSSLLRPAYTRSPWNDISIHSYDAREYSRWSDRLSNTNRDEIVWKGASPKKVDVNYRGGRSAPKIDRNILNPVSVQRSLTHNADYSWREWTAPKKATFNWMDKTVAHKNDNNWGKWAPKKTEYVSKWNQRSGHPNFESMFNNRSQSLRGNRWRRSSMEDMSSREILTSHKASTTTSSPPQYEQTGHEEFGWGERQTAPQDSPGENLNGWSSTAGGSSQYGDPKYESGWSENIQNGWGRHSSAPISSMPLSQPYKGWENVAQKNNYNKNSANDNRYNDNYSSSLQMATEGPDISYSVYNGGAEYKSPTKVSKLKNYKKSYRPTVIYPRYSNYGHILHEDTPSSAVYNYNDPDKTPAMFKQEHVTQKPRVKNTKNHYSYSYNRNSVKSTTVVPPTSSPPSMPYSLYVGYESGSNEHFNEQQYYNPYTSNEIDNTWGAPPSPSQYRAPEWTTPEKAVTQTVPAPIPTGPIYEELARPVATAQAAGTGWATPIAETRHKNSWTKQVPISKKKPLVKEYFGKVVDNFNTLCSAVFPLLGNLGRGRFCVRKDGHGYHFVNYNGQGWSYK